MRVSQFVLNKYNKVGNRCFNLNREANYRSIFSLGFLLLFITQYSYRIALSFLALTPQNLRKNPGGAVDWNRSSPGCHFWPRNGKIKTKKKWSDWNPGYLWSAYIVYLCVICNSNIFHSFIFKLCIMIVHTLKMCTGDACPEQSLVLVF